MSVEPGAFRKALAAWASGVTIVTARDGDHIHGMTVSAFASVSLDPPLVLVCAEKSSDTHGVIQAGKVFTVNVLASGQDELSNRFASSRDEHLRFVGLDCAEGETGCPRIPGAVAAIDCRVENAVDAGDHVVYIGEVQAVDVTDAPPLIYFRGAYRELE